MNPEPNKIYPGDVLAASLENKRLREALEEFKSDDCGLFHDGTTCCLKEAGISVQAEEALSSPDHSQLAALYLELREKARIWSKYFDGYNCEANCDAYENFHQPECCIKQELRDIIKIFKEQR